LDKGFQESQQAYAYYTYDLGLVPVNRIVTLQYDRGSRHEKDIFSDKDQSIMGTTQFYVSFHHSHFPEQFQMSLIIQDLTKKKTP